MPFLYSTNGEVLWFHDVRYRQSRSRRIAKFRTLKLSTSSTLVPSSPSSQRSTPCRSKELLSAYQVEANQAIENAIGERKRKMLIMMVTGTGKTLTLVNQIYRLMKAGVARRMRFRPHAHVPEAKS